MKKFNNSRLGILGHLLLILSVLNFIAAVINYLLQNDLVAVNAPVSIALSIMTIIRIREFDAKN